MSASKVVLLTGASRGIGLAIAQYLIKSGAKVYLVARSVEPLKKLKTEYPGLVEYTTADLSDLSSAKDFAEPLKGTTYLDKLSRDEPDPDLARLRVKLASAILIHNNYAFTSFSLLAGTKIVNLAVEAFGRLDSLIVNHGALSAVKRIADTTAEDWRLSYDINLFSAVAIIQPALQYLRTSQGRIILTSSGAATGAYATWGAYGSAKAALNHLGMTLAVEEPSITTVSIRPGVVDTEMQSVVRSHNMVMDAKDAEKFKSLHESGKLLRPEQPGNVIARLAIEGNHDLSGKFLSWDDESLAQYQDL